MVGMALRLNNWIYYPNKTCLNWGLEKLGSSCVMKRDQGVKGKRVRLSSVAPRCHGGDWRRKVDEDEDDDDGNCFVERMREAQPYLRLHRGSTIVVLLTSQFLTAINHHRYLQHILEDISLLHGLGIKFVIVPGTHIQIDKILKERGREPKYAGQHRVTDSSSLQVAIDASARICNLIEAKLSPGPSLTHVRRHGTHRHDAGVPVATGNFVAAKRRGVVDGIDHGATGEVKRIDVAKILNELDKGQIVMLNNLGYSSSSEALNCNSYEIATACALALGAEKLICIIDGPIVDECGHLLRFLSLDDADSLIRKHAKQSEMAANYVQATIDEEEMHDHTSYNKQHSATFKNGVGFNDGNGFWCSSNEHGFAIGGNKKLNEGYISELAAAAYVCRGGVRRVHLLDGTLTGVLLLELLQRDGAGTMIASDVYEGTRVARVSDIDGIKQIIQPLEESGELVSRSEEQLVKEVEAWIVVEREGQIIACAALVPFFKDKCGELAAIAVSHKCRGQGQGDKLLEYIEKKASSLGMEMLFMLTTRTADWFVRRGFSECLIECLPEGKRIKISLSKGGSKYYMKKLFPIDKSRLINSQVKSIH